VTDLITPYALFSPVFLQSCFVIHESGSDNSFQRYVHSKFSKMAAGHHLGFGPTGSRSIRSTVPENPTVGSNTKSIGRPVAEIWPFVIFQNARSVGRSSVLNIYMYIVLLYSSSLRSERGVKQLGGSTLHAAKVMIAEEQ